MLTRDLVSDLKKVARSCSSSAESWSFHSGPLETFASSTAPDPDAPPPSAAAPPAPPSAPVAYACSLLDDPAFAFYYGAFETVAFLCCIYYPILPPPG